MISKLYWAFRKWCTLAIAGYRYEKAKQSGIDLDFIKVLRLAPGDVLVIKTKETLSSDSFDKLKGYVQGILKDQNNVIILDGDWKMEVLRIEPVPESKKEELAQVV